MGVNKKGNDPAGLIKRLNLYTYVDSRVLISEQVNKNSE
jgi:hypothetical protein